jgi:DNA-binding NtrC family response regulator
MKKILVAEDEPTLREGIATAFRQRQWHVTEASDGGKAIELLEKEIFDVLVTDYKMPVSDGLEVLKHCKTLNEGTVALVMTAYGTVESAVEAMRAGAYDYVLKPFALEELELKVQRALEHRRLLARIVAHDHGTAAPVLPEMVGVSRPMQEVFRMIDKVARSSTTVLILGETGTGKELVAEALHRKSDRKDRPFVKLNCAAVPESLLETELFGHEKGAFTGAERQRVGRFELANEGTLFLDEVGSMAPSVQAKLLRVLQEREFERLGGTRSIKVDVRLVAATNRDLASDVSRGGFREDLYYRLNVVSIKLPALRERPDDIAPLAEYFRKRFAAELKKSLKGFDAGALEALERHIWPGNIRELQNSIERAVLLSDGPLLTAQDLKLPVDSVPQEDCAEPPGVRLPASGMKLDEVEKQTLVEALRLHNWVQKDAAKFLGISPRTMNYKVAKYQIKNPRWSKNRQ